MANIYNKVLLSSSFESQRQFLNRVEWIVALWSSNPLSIPDSSNHKESSWLFLMLFHFPCLGFLITEDCFWQSGGAKSQELQHHYLSKVLMQPRGSWVIMADFYWLHVTCQRRPPFSFSQIFMSLIFTTQGSVFCSSFHKWGNCSSEFITVCQDTQLEKGRKKFRPRKSESRNNTYNNYAILVSQWLYL